jgi:hypothetical protein
MTNLMCRGRKRGLAGIVATQRLAKLAKNVAAEASNFLMGRTFLDIDMARAADLLGMERRQAEQIRDLERGHFLGLGPAISRRPVARAHRLRILPGMDLNAFRRRFAMAVAGIADDSEARWADLLHIARDVADDLLAPFLALARAAVEGAPCPDDEALATIYGTRSSGRIRRLLEHLEKSDLIVVRTDYGGRRSVGIPALGLTTAPVEA